MHWTYTYLRKNGYVAVDISTSQAPGPEQVLNNAGSLNLLDKEFEDFKSKLELYSSVSFEELKK